mgnify:FL=1
MSMSNNKKTQLEGQKVYAHGVNKDTHFNTPQGPRLYPQYRKSDNRPVVNNLPNYDKQWGVSGYYNDNDGNDIRDRD